MLTLIINTLIIVFIVTVVWDLSGFMGSLTSFIYRLLNPGKPYRYQQLPKLISCSYCVKFHSVWIYLIIFNNVPIIIGLGIASAFTFIGQLLSVVLKKLTIYINTL